MKIKREEKYESQPTSSSNTLSALLMFENVRVHSSSSRQKSQQKNNIKIFYSLERDSKINARNAKYSSFH
jgi:hypothetical protein